MVLNVGLDESVNNMQELTRIRDKSGKVNRTKVCRMNDELPFEFQWVLH
jgi:hypothetical protein